MVFLGYFSHHGKLGRISSTVHFHFPGGIAYRSTWERYHPAPLLSPGSHHVATTLVSQMVALMNGLLLPASRPAKMRMFLCFHIFFMTSSFTIDPKMLVANLLLSTSLLTCLTHGDKAQLDTSVVGRPTEPQSSAKVRLEDGDSTASAGHFGVLLLIHFILNNIHSTQRGCEVIGDS